MYASLGDEGASACTLPCKKAELPAVMLPLIVKLPSRSKVNTSDPSASMVKSVPLLVRT